MTGTPAASAAEEREFFDGIKARMVWPFRGGRATVAVGVPQNPHTYYMGATGGSWSLVGFRDVPQIGEIRGHPDDPDTVWVAAQGNAYLPADDGGIFKSTHGGST